MIYFNRGQTISVPWETITYNSKGEAISRSSGVNKLDVLRVSSLPKKQSGRIVDGWRKPTSRARGYFKTSPAHGLKIDRSGTGYRTYSGELTSYGSILLNIPWLDQSLSTVDPPFEVTQKARNKAVLKVNECKVNLGQAIMEVKDTMSTVAATASRVLRAYRALRRGKVSKALKYLAIDKGHRLKSKDFADRWLELQFGWQPLISDVYSGYEVATRVVKTKRLALRATANAYESTELPYGSSMSSKYKVLGKAKVSSNCTLWYEIEDPNLAWAASLGLLNPALLAWEAVPFSFVIDWFLPVGNFLQCLSTPLGVKFLSGTTTNLTEGFGIVMRPGDLAYSSQDFSYRMYDRDTLSSFPLAWPFLKSPFSTTHVLDALALLTNFRK